MRYRLFFILIMFTFSRLMGQVSTETVGQLPMELNEYSGHIFFDGNLIAHNDSGNEPILYVLDTLSMQITKRVNVVNAENMDWEDITQDDDHIYVGDIGNNLGTRKDLVIYKILKDDFTGQDEVNADIISFAYEDQENFDDKGESDWDAEAMTVVNNELWIFTKQWVTQGTVGYSVPKEPGNHLAKRMDSYQVNGLVTGATYNELNNDLLFSAYSNTLEPFVIRIKDVDTSGIFDGTVEHISLDIDFAQVEAITAISAQRYFIGSEQFERSNLSISLNPTLYSLQFSSEEEVNEEEIPEEEESPNNDQEEDRLLLYGTYDSEVLSYDLLSDKSVLAQAIFDTSGKMVRFQLGADIENNNLYLNTLKSGVYYLTVYLGDKVLSEPFLAY